MTDKSKPDPLGPVGPKPIDPKEALEADREAHLEGYKKTVPRIGEIAKKTKENDAGTSLPPFKK
jgi:hypothetical protein